MDLERSVDDNRNKNFEKPFIRKEGGMIYFTLKSNGLKGKEWIKHLEKKGFKVGDKYIRGLLLSDDFKSTKGVNYNIIIVLGKEIGNDGKFTTNNVSEKAESLGLMKPTAEIGCLIREVFTDEEIKSMGLERIVVMHDPIVVEGDRERIGLHVYDDGGLLDAYHENPEGVWDNVSGFVYLESNKKNENKK